MKKSDARVRVDALRLYMMRQRTREREYTSFDYKPFSIKQKKVLTWWLPNSPVRGKEGIICDGSIRAGKTIAMSLSFGLWSMTAFNQENFILAGKTIGSLRRNVVTNWKRMMRAQGYRVKDKRSESLVTVSKGEATNFYYLFGGNTEASQDLVQGITAAGAFFDEVVLMPQSFVEQAVGRCSVDGSKFWFNCNPDHPEHFFKVEYIDKLLCNKPKDAPLLDKDGNPIYKDLLHIEKALQDIIKAILWVGKNILGQPVNPDAVVTVNSSDGYIISDEEKRADDRMDVASMILQRWEYRMRWYGEDEETAKAAVQEKTLTFGAREYPPGEDGG